MHVQLINRSAVLRFGPGDAAKIGHGPILDEIAHLALNHQFTRFILDFGSFDVGFSSLTVGFLLGAARKLSGMGVEVVLRGVGPKNFALLVLAGFQDIAGNVIIEGV
jgi:anti-anti-sigma regulatory factor